MSTIHEPSDSVEAGSHRAVIHRGPDLHLDADKAEQALIQHPEIEVYSHGQSLVEIVRPQGAHPSLCPVKTARMRDLLSRAVIWMSGDGEHPRQIRAPRDLAETILSRHTSQFPVLDGIVCMPMLRPDGSIMDEPGYDRATRLLFEPSIAFPQVPREPDRAQALAALAALRDPLVEFPWLEPSDQSAAISAILALVGRAAISGPVPLYGIRAATPGTGKSLLADVFALVATGHPANRTVVAKQDDEMRKLILALGREGTPLVLLDNVEGALGSASLAAALTGETYQDRILGASATSSIRLRAIWIATGNGLTFRGDLGRRVVPIDLDARVEHPEDRRDFKYPDLRAHVRIERGQLVAAALTILRAYHLAGRPQPGGSGMGSFEAWDTWIRGACMWLDLADPAQGRQRIREQGDSELEALRSVMEVWAKSVGSEPVKVAQVVRSAEQDQELRGALETLVNSSTVDSRNLGAALKRYRGRPVDGQMFEAIGKAGGATRWRLVASQGAPRMERTC